MSNARRSPSRSRSTRRSSDECSSRRNPAPGSLRPGTAWRHALFCSFIHSCFSIFDSLTGTASALQVAQQHLDEERPFSQLDPPAFAFLQQLSAGLADERDAQEVEQHRAIEPSVCPDHFLSAASPRVCQSGYNRHLLRFALDAHPSTLK